MISRIAILSKTEKYTPAKETRIFYALIPARKANVFTALL